MQDFSTGLLTGSFKGFHKAALRASLRVPLNGLGKVSIRL